MIVVIVINSQAESVPELGIWDAIGLLMWLLGFSIEVIADNQKRCSTQIQKIRVSGLTPACGLTLDIQITWER